MWMFPYLTFKFSALQGKLSVTKAILFLNVKIKILVNKKFILFQLPEKIMQLAD